MSGAYLSGSHGLDCEALRRGRERGATAMLDALPSAPDKAIARRVATRRAVAAKAWALSSPRSRCASIASLGSPSPSLCSGGPGHGYHSNRLLTLASSKRGRFRGPPHRDLYSGQWPPPPALGPEPH